LYVLANPEQCGTTFDFSPSHGRQTYSYAAQQESSKSGFKYQVENSASLGNACRKNATREMERSSCGVLEEANIDRKTAGVTGMRLEESDGWKLLCVGWAVSFEEVVEETERGMIAAHNVTVMMLTSVCSALSLSYAMLTAAIRSDIL